MSGQGVLEGFQVTHWTRMNDKSVNSLNSIKLSMVMNRRIYFPESTSSLLR